MDPFKRRKNYYGAIHSDNGQSCQAPIRPFFQVIDPGQYKTHTSDTLLGNATIGRKSKKYFKYTTYTS
jgi:hypothetical protein